MNNRLLQFCLLWLALLLCAPPAKSQLCDPTKVLYVQHCEANSGGSSRLSSKTCQMEISVGSPIIGATENPNHAPGDFSGDLGFWSFMMLEPSTPIVTASDGDYPDRIEVRWDALNDADGPPVTQQQLYRDGQFLGTFAISDSAYLDFNVIPGHTYRYDVVTKNDCGASVAGTDVGFVNPNGIITGLIQTTSMKAVDGVEVALTPTMGYSVRFDGQNDKIVLSDSAVNNLRTGAIEFWIYPAKLTGGTVLSKLWNTDPSLVTKTWSGDSVEFAVTIGSYYDDAGQQVVDGDSGRLYFRASGGASIASRSRLSAYQWTHVAIVFDAVRAQIYFNGVFDKEIMGNFAISDNHFPRDPAMIRTYAGYWNGVGNYFQGNLDELRIWNKDRTQDQLTQNMRRTIDPDDSTLCLYWKFDEEKGMKTFDLSKHRNNGVFCAPLAFDGITRAPVSTSGVTDKAGNYTIKGINYASGTTFAAAPHKTTIIGRALELDGIDDAVVTDSAVGISTLSSGSGTIEAWAYFHTTSGLQPIIALRNNIGDADSSSGILSMNNGQFQFQGIGSGTLAVDHTPLDTGKWYHIAVTFSASGAALFVNGEAGAAVNGDFSIDPAKPSTITTIGAFGSTHLYGRIDEVRVWNSQRSQQQIQANMNQPFTTSQDSLQGYWKMNEGAGATMFDDTPNLDKGNILNADSTIWTSHIPMNETFIHSFFPESRNVTLAPSSTVVDRIEFTDQSMLTVTGFVKFDGRSCPVESAQVLVDGKSTSQLIYTGRDGKFTVELEPGSTHSISLQKGDHQFVPAFYEVRNISRPVYIERPFNDMKKFNLSGDVVGGTCRYALDAKSDVHIRSLSGCIDTIVTVAANASGHYGVPNLPPLIYIIGCSTDNPAIHFDADTLSLLKSDRTRDFVYRAPMEAAIDIVGEPADTCIHDIVLKQGKFYSTTIHVFERYGANLCDIQKGTVTIVDHISSRSVEFPFSNGKRFDTFLARNVNIISPYELRYEAVAKDTLGREASAGITAVVLGTMPRGKTYASALPLEPIMVLRDPPGDASYSYGLKDSSYTVQSYQSFDTLTGYNASSMISFIPKVETDLGLGAEVKVEVKPVLIENISVTGDSIRSLYYGSQKTVTFSSQFSTSASADFIGSGGDVYIGNASMISYSIGDTLSLNGCNFTTGPTIALTGDSATALYVYSESYLNDIEIPRLRMLATDPGQDQEHQRLYQRSADAWQKWISLNASMKDKAKFIQNVTWDAGAVIDRSVQTAHDTTWSLTQRFDFNASIGGQLGITFNEMGVILSANYLSNGAATQGSSTSVDTAITWGYHLEDDDPGDLHGVAIYEAADGAPVFKSLGGETSCPWEPGTMKREGVAIGVDTTTLVNVPPDQPAVFRLTVGNLSPTKEERTYQITVPQESNPYGAVIKVNGIAIENALQITIPADQQVPLTLTVDRGPRQYIYDNLKVALSSLCDSQIDTVTEFSVHFLVPCSEVTMDGPANGWTVSSHSPRGDTVAVLLSGYDMQNADFKDLKLQYRPISATGNSAGKTTSGNKLVVDPLLYQPIGAPFALKADRNERTVAGANGVLDNPWINAKTILKGSLPPGQNFITIDWVLTSDIFPDGKYEIRAISECKAQTINGASAPIAGRIDRTPPMLLAASSEPVGGILGTEDQIVARFNEAIDTSWLMRNQDQVHLTNTSTGNEINKTLSCDGSAVTVVIPPDQYKYLENTVLRISFTGVRDLLGNFDANRHEYEFYVQRGTMRWDSPVYQATTSEGQGVTFTRQITNSGGFAQRFTMKDLPVWLTVSPMSVMVSPGGTQNVVFTISPQLTGGFYKDTVYASTQDGDERFLLDFRVLCPGPAWSVNEAAYQYSMNIDAILRIDTSLVTDEATRIAAFVGNEVRGVANIAFIDHAPQQYQVFLTIYSNRGQGDPVTFKVWDATSCRELGYITESYRFAADSVSGRPDMPVTLTATRQVGQQIPLKTGWTWFSFNLKAQNDSTNNLLRAVSSVQNDLVRNQSSFSQYATGLGWVGTLSTMNVKSMYQAKLACRDTIEYVGYPLLFDTTAIPIVTGWNWIGYQPQTGYEINYALTLLHPLNGNLIKSQTAYAMYASGLGWVGSMNYMSPKQGYLYKSGNTDLLQYPPPPGGPVGLPKIPTPETDHTTLAAMAWTCDPAQYQFNMPVTGVVEKDGADIGDSSDVVGAFINGECRGSAQALYVPGLHKYLFFLMVYSNAASGEPVEFRFYDASGNMTYGLSGKVSFAQDDAAGSPTAPFIWTRSTALAVGVENGLPKEFRLGQNFPNPFNPSTVILYQLPVNGHVTLKVYNTLGAEVATLINGTQDAGYKSIEWNATDNNGKQLPSGVYFYRMTAGSFNDVKKLLLIR